MKTTLYVGLLGALLAIPAHAIDGSSRYIQLNSDVLITSNSSTGQTVLQTSITLSSGKWVFVNSDGRFFPFQQNGVATMEVRVGGTRISNASILDFRVSAPVQHSFNCIGATFLSAGTHTVELVGYNHPGISGGKFKVGSTSNLSVVVDPANTVTHSELAVDSSVVDVTTGSTPFQPPIQYLGVLSENHFVSEPPLIVLTSGRSYTSLERYGDAMWGTYANFNCPQNDEHFWTVNDIAESGEIHAPMYGQAMYRTATAWQSLQLAATELPTGGPPNNFEDDVAYKVGSTTKIVGLSGNLPIHASKAELPFDSCQPNSYIFADGTRDYWSTSFTVSSEQQGNVMFLLKTRILDCYENEGPGTVRLQLWARWFRSRFGWSPTVYVQ